MTRLDRVIHMVSFQHMRFLGKLLEYHMDYRLKGGNDGGVNVYCPPAILSFR